MNDPYGGLGSVEMRLAGGHRWHHLRFSHPVRGGSNSGS